MYFSSIYFYIKQSLLCFIVCLTCHVKQTLLHKVCCCFIFPEFYRAGCNPPIWRLPSHMLKRLEGLEIWHWTAWVSSQILCSQYFALRSSSESKVKRSAALLLIPVYKDTPSTSTCFWNDCFYRYLRVLLQSLKWFVSEIRWQPRLLPEQEQTPLMHSDVCIR